MRRQAQAGLGVSGWGLPPLLLHLLLLSVLLGCLPASAVALRTLGGSLHDPAAESAWLDSLANGLVQDITQR